MTNKHTQGKWILNTKNRSDMRITNGERGFVIAEVTSDAVAHFIGNLEEAEANAKLIAASPELLEVLNKINLALLLSSELDKPYWSRIAQQAIDKATK